MNQDLKDLRKNLEGMTDWSLGQALKRVEQLLDSSRDEEEARVYLKGLLLIEEELQARNEVRALERE